MVGENAMPETVTLELSDDVARRAREAAHRTGRQLEEVLTEWIGHAAASEETMLLMPGSSYPIYTPYGNEAAAQELLDALTSSAAAGRTSDQDE
jgi:hypothetical protein